MKSIYSKVPKASRLYCLVAVLFLSHHAHSFALSSQPTKWPFNPPHDAQVKVYAVSESSMVNTYKSIDWQAQWWPIAFESVTDKTRPYPFELLSIPIVIWWDNNGKRWNAVKDACPHRLAPLSEGRIDPSTGCIECPYHGWTFEGKLGKCTRIPQLEDGEVPPEARTAATVAAYPTTVAQGIIWVWGQSLQSLCGRTPSVDLIPLCPPLVDEDLICLDVSRDVPYSYEQAKENLLDPSHVPFTHHATIGRRSYASPVPLKLTSEVTLAGFRGTWERNIPASPMTKKHLGRVERETLFNAPSYMHHLISTPEVSTWTVTYATPSRPGQCRILARFPFKFPDPVTDTGSLGGFNTTPPASPLRGRSWASRLRRAIFLSIPDWMQHLQQNRVLDDDNIFLAVQERRLLDPAGSSSASWVKRYYMPTKADLFVAQFRRWIDTYGKGGPFGALTADALEELDYKTLPDVLLDRYHQHTRHCASCSRALACVRRWKPRILGAGLLIGTLGKRLLDVKLTSNRSEVVVVALIGLLAFSWQQLSRIEGDLTRGPYPPPRNAVESGRKHGNL
ncbi:pheophorbide a oxygenase [Nannochloropsis gaditana]|uniref:Pheophorbide a oxygenase n=1 Tax=Nannochloropsis gaditana TaxID=72520 RepID=W7TDU0_9STRA|nr:pheophorbide a oxygenase [Nannochloropsis gaditana]